MSSNLSNTLKPPSDILAHLMQVCDRHPEVQVCYLFGSAATGTLKPTSDIDLGVAGHGPLDAGQKLALQTDLEQALQRDVDLVDLLSATGTILRNALRGTCLLCRDPHIKYQVTKRLIYDQEDLQPLRRRLMNQRRRMFLHGS